MSVTLRDLAAEVLHFSDGEWTVGSGLVVGDGLILTAAHSVGPGKLNVRFIGGDERPARLLLSGDEETADWAVIGFEGNSPSRRWRFGEVDREWPDCVRPCWSVGFPQFMELDEDPPRRMLAQVVGEIPTVENLGAHLLTFRVQSSPLEHLSGSPWAAMSGAVVVAGDDVIVGVVSEHRRPRGSDVLTIVPITALDDRDDASAWWELLPGAEPRARVKLPEPAGRRRRPYIATVVDLAPDRLVGREDELATLAAFATGYDAYRWMVGGPWHGKTALLAQFVRACPANVDVVAYFLRSPAADADSGRFLQRINDQLAFLLKEDAPQRADASSTFKELWAAVSAQVERNGRHLLLVVDGLSDDRSHSLGLPSLAQELPRHAGGHCHVLVSSRVKWLEPDVPFDHPLRWVDPVKLDRSPLALKVELRRRHELDQVLARADILSKTLLELLGAAHGPLSVDDLTELVRISYPIERHRMASQVANDLSGLIEPVSGTDPQRFAFAHPTLRETVERELGASELREYRDGLHVWAQRYVQRDWPADGVPRYLLDAYPALLLATAPERLEALYGDLAYVETAILTMGVAHVERDVAAAAGKGGPLVEQLSRVLKLEAHNLRSEQRVAVRGYVARQLCLQAIQCDAATVATRTRVYLERLPRPQLVPRWASSRPPAALMRMLDGRGGPVTAVALSGDGLRAASGSADHVVRIWDVQSGERLYELPGSESGALAMSADGSCVLSGGLSGELLIWEPGGGRSQRVLRAHRGEVVVAVSADGTRAVSGGWNRNAAVWDVPSGALVRHLEHSSWVTAVAMSEDGRRAATICDDHCHRVWDLESGRIIRSVHGHAQLRALAIDRRGARVLSSDRAGELRVWDALGGQTVCALDGVAGSMIDLAMDVEGHWAVSTSFGGELQIWDLTTGRATATLPGHVGGKAAVGIDDAATTAITAGEEGTLKVWDVQRASNAGAATSDADTSMGVSMCGAGSRAVSGGTGGHPRLLDVESGEVVKVLKGHERTVTSITINADATRALSANDHGVLWVWDLCSGELLRRLEHNSWVTAVAISEDGTRGVSASQDTTVRVWDLDSGELIKSLQGHGEWVTAVAISRDGRRAVSGAYGSMRHWSLETGDVLHHHSEHTGEVRTAAIDGSGRYAVSGCENGTLIVWDLADGRTVRTLRGHDGKPVSAVAVHDDQLRAVSAGEDETLRLWDLASGACLAEFISIPPAVALCLGPEHRGERKLLTAGGPSGIRLYTLLERH